MNALKIRSAGENAECVISKECAVVESGENKMTAYILKHWFQASFK